MAGMFALGPEELPPEPRGWARLDMDPGLAPDEYSRVWTDGYAAGWEDAPRVVAHHRGARFAVAALVALAFGVGLFVGVRVALAAPRSAAQPVIPAGPSALLEAAGRIDQGSSGNLAERPSGAPQPEGARLSRPGEVTDRPSAAGAPSRTIRGIASFVASRYGDRYLALPDGPGHSVRICGPATCVVRTSTDAGPALFLQRQGRIADLSRADFARLCGCTPEVVGLIHVTVTRFDGPAPTPPATDR